MRTISHGGCVVNHTFMRHPSNSRKVCRIVKTALIIVVVTFSTAAMAGARGYYMGCLDEWREQSRIGSQPVITSEIENVALAWGVNNFPGVSDVNRYLMKLHKHPSDDDVRRFKRQEKQIQEVEWYAALSCLVYEQSLALKMDTSECSNDFARIATNVIVAYRAVATSKSWQSFTNRNPRSAERAKESIQQLIDNLDAEVLRMLKMVAVKKAALHSAYIAKNPKVYQTYLARKEKERVDNAIWQAEMRARQAEARARSAEAAAEAARIEAQNAACDAMSANRDAAAARNAANAAHWRLNRAGVW